MSYFGAAAAASSVGGPGLLVQAVGDGEERNVVVPQLRADSLREHPVQQRGPLEIHLVAKHRQQSQTILRFDLGQICICMSYLDPGHFVLAHPGVDIS